MSSRDVIRNRKHPGVPVSILQPLVLIEQPSWQTYMLGRFLFFFLSVAQNADQNPTPEAQEAPQEHTVSKVKSIRCISHGCAWELLPQNNANGLFAFLPLCNLLDGCPVLWLNLPVHASAFSSFFIHFAQSHIRAGRYDKYISPGW